MTALIRGTAPPPSLRAWDLSRPGILQGKTTPLFLVIGDGSLTGAWLMKHWNNAARLETNFIIILNDNNMSISEKCGRRIQISEQYPYLKRLSDVEGRHLRRHPQHQIRRTGGCRHPPRQEQLKAACNPRHVLRIWALSSGAGGRP